MSVSLRSALLGALILAIVLALGVWAVAGLGLYDFAADVPHTVPVRNFINYARDHSVSARLSDITVPTLTDPKMIAAGAGAYDRICSGCHLGPGIKENALRAGLYPKPPSFARRRRPGNAAEQFWDVKHGFKMSAMPAWGTSLSDADIWNIVAFFQTLPKQTPESYKALVAAAPPG